MDSAWKNLKLEVHLGINESFPTRQIKEVKLGARDNWHVHSGRHERQDLWGQQGFCTSEARINRNQCGNSATATLVQDAVISPVDSCNNFFAIPLPLGCFPSNPHPMFHQ